MAGSRGISIARLGVSGDTDGSSIVCADVPRGVGESARGWTGARAWCHAGGGPPLALKNWWRVGTWTCVWGREGKGWMGGDMGRPRGRQVSGAL